MHGGIVVIAALALACGDFGPGPFRGNARRLLTGEATACAIESDGHVACWGVNTIRWEFGASPMAIPGARAPVRAPVPLLASFATGVSSHFCGITPDSKAVCWGRGAFGQLGAGALGDSGNAAVNVRSGLRWTDLAVGRLSTCGRSDDGLGLCWGANQHGEIGVAFITLGENTISPVEVDGGLRFRQIVPGWIHTCGIIDDGRLFCWGSNDRGQIGASTPDPQTQRTPVAVGPNLRFSEISLGAKHTCGLATDGIAYCWGENFSGQLGDGTTTSRETPTAVATTVRFAHIATSSGFAGGSNVGLLGATPGQIAHTCALTATGAAHCWGWNGSGQLGDGTTTTQPAPVPVGGSHVFDTIGLGGAYTCGITGGTVWCWGSNALGQLGAGLTAGASATPVQVSANFGNATP